MNFRAIALLTLLVALTPTLARSQAPVASVPRSESPPQAVPTAPSSPFTDRMNEFPSLWQKDPRAGFPGDGSNFCMPVAASNALMWLADHGYPKLLPDTSAPGAIEAERGVQQVALVKAFTSPPYATMKEHGGASVGWIARGVRHYIEDRGYTIDQMVSRPVLAPSTGKPRSLTLNEIKADFRTGAVVWLLIGRYQPVPGVADTYERASGHGLTLVGFGVDEAGHPDPNVLIVHDPAKHRAGGTWPNDRWHLGVMGGGHLPGKGADLNKPGKSMAGRYVIIPQQGAGPAKGRFSLLEEATVLRLRPVK